MSASDTEAVIGSDASSETQVVFVGTCPREETTRESRNPNGEERRRQLVVTRIPRVRLEAGEVYAEIIEDRRSRPRVVFCVVQKDGSSEVLFLGQFYSRGDAESAAMQFISDYLSRHPEVSQSAA